jgi:hypothetical protein
MEQHGEHRDDTSSESRELVEVEGSMGSIAELHRGTAP